MKRIIFKLLIVFTILAAASECKAQRFGFSTNLVDWVTLSPNARLDARLTNHVSLDISVAGNPFTFGFGKYNTRINNFRFQPEIRYWFTRPFTHHYLGFALLGAWYSAHIPPTSRQLSEAPLDVAGNPIDPMYRALHGDGFAFGPTYGFAIVLNKNWNLEFTAGVGLACTRYMDFVVWDSSTVRESKIHHRCIPIPMNIGVSFTYIIL